MKRIILAAALALGLAGCGPQLQQLGSFVSSAAGFTATQQDLDAAILGYNAAFLAPAANYRKLPLCAKGQTFLKDHCRTHRLTVRLQQADNAVKAAFDDVQNAIDQHNNAGIAAAYRVLSDAIKAATDIIAANGI